MKIVIDIPDKVWNIAKEYGHLDICGIELSERVMNGTPYEERPKGEWIMQRHDLDGCFYTCSNCGRMIRVPLFIDDPEDNETLADYPFCHCGAEMRGDNNDK